MEAQRTASQSCHKRKWCFHEQAMCSLGNGAVGVGTCAGKKQCEHQPRARQSPGQPRATTRPVLSQPSEEAWHQLVALSLPTLCISGLMLCDLAYLNTSLFYRRRWFDALAGDRVSWVGVVLFWNSEGVSQLFLAFSVAGVKCHFRFLIFLCVTFFFLIVPRSVKDPPCPWCQW